MRRLRRSRRHAAGQSREPVSYVTPARNGGGQYRAAHRAGRLHRGAQRIFHAAVAAKRVVRAGEQRRSADTAAPGAARRRAGRSRQLVAMRPGRGARHQPLDGAPLRPAVAPPGGSWALAGRRPPRGRSTRSWLARTDEALSTRNYEGVFVHEHAGETETLRVIHRVDAKASPSACSRWTGRAANSSARAASSSATCPTSTRCWWSAAREAATAARRPAAHGRQARPGNTTSSEIARTRVSGRDARVIAIAPLDQLRYGYRVWIDEATAMPLKTQLRDSQGQRAGADRVHRVCTCRAYRDAELEPGGRRAQLPLGADTMRSGRCRGAVGVVGGERAAGRVSHDGERPAGAARRPGRAPGIQRRAGIGVGVRRSRPRNSGGGAEQVARRCGAPRGSSAYLDRGAGLSRHRGRRGAAGDRARHSAGDPCRGTPPSMAESLLARGHPGSRADDGGRSSMQCRVISGLGGWQRRVAGNERRGRRLWRPRPAPPAPPSGRPAQSRPALSAPDGHAGHALTLLTRPECGLCQDMPHGLRRCVPRHVLPPLALPTWTPIASCSAVMA